MLDQFKYSYDPAGNITKIDKYRAGLESDSGLFSYSYDPVGRLVSATHDGNTKEYRYDSLGNRISSLQNRIETKHSYNARNQLIRTEESEAISEYLYDKRGNLTVITKNGMLESRYDFDATNRMVAAFTEGKGKAEYSYNGFLKRVKRLEDMQDTSMPDPTHEMRYILDLTRPYDNLLMTEGAQNQSFVWGNELLSASGDSSFHYLTDHLGSPIRLVSENQSDTLAYDEFGVALVGAGNIHQPFGFTGYQTDNISGLYYAQARYFSAENARFISEDYVRDGVNWYLHCRGNPLRFVDLDGLAPTPVEAAEMAQHIYDAQADNKDVLSGGWKLDEIKRSKMGESWSNLKMGLYSREVDGTTEYALVNKGTTPLSGNDWLNNIFGYLGFSSDVWESMGYAKYYDKLLKDYELTMIGHSKAGAEAIANALATGRDAITFNTMILNLALYGLDASQYPGTMTHFVVMGDILNKLFGEPSVGNVVYLEGKFNWLSLIPAEIQLHLMAAIIDALNNLQDDGCKIKAQ